MLLKNLKKIMKKSSESYEFEESVNCMYFITVIDAKSKRTWIFSSFGVDFLVTPFSCLLLQKRTKKLTSLTNFENLNKHNIEIIN